MQEFAQHRSGGGFALGWFVVVVAAGTVVDGAVADGYTARDRALTIAIAVAVGAVAYLLGIRPSLDEEPTRLLVRNPLRDTQIPWRSFQDARMKDVLVVEAGRDVRCFAVPRRRERVRMSTVFDRSSQPAPTGLDLPARLRELAQRMSVGESAGEVQTNWSPAAAAAAFLVVAAAILVVIIS